MAKRGVKKIGSLGPAFLAMMKILDYCESMCVRMEKAVKNPDIKSMPVKSEKLGSAVTWAAQHYDPLSQNMLEWANRIVISWGSDAANFRQAFKFKASHNDLIRLSLDSPVRGDMEFRLPFDQCVLVLDEPNTDAKSLENHQYTKPIRYAIIYAENRFVDDMSEGDWYDKQGLRVGDMFVSAYLGLMLENDPDLFLIPAEFHIVSGLQMFTTSGAEIEGGIPWSGAVPHGSPKEIEYGIPGYGDFIINALIQWVVALNCPKTKHDVRTGLKPGVIHTPRRKERVFYEHTLMTIDPTEVVEVKDPTGSHSKHRLHPVRGFWRRYKSGKTTWVRPHWRGDKELGVVTHDYEVKHGQESN